MIKLPIKIAWHTRGDKVHVHATTACHIKTGGRPEDLPKLAVQAANDLSAKYLAEVNNEITRIQEKVAQLALFNTTSEDDAMTRSICLKLILSSLDRLRQFTGSYELADLKISPSPNEKP